MDEKELRELLDYWQKVLRLQDWNLKIEYHRTSPLWRDHGESHIFQKFKQAEIWVRHPEDQPSGVKGRQEIEDTLVHELIHVIIHQMYENPRGKGSDQEEAGIECLAQAFVNLNRGIRPA